MGCDFCWLFVLLWMSNVGDGVVFVVVFLFIVLMMLLLIFVVFGVIF